MEVGDFSTFDSVDPLQLKGGDGYINIFGDLYSATGAPFVELDLSGNELVGSPEYSVNFFAVITGAADSYYDQLTELLRPLLMDRP